MNRALVIAGLLAVVGVAWPGASAARVNGGTRKTGDGPARVAKAGRAGAEAGPEVVTAKFDTFCADWMQKLATRERDNRAGIQWQAGPDGVHGQYVGYMYNNRCEVKPQADPSAVPIGKIVYREVTYQHQGASVSAAETSAPSIVDQTEITEIFRYTKGQWVY